MKLLKIVKRFFRQIISLEKPVSMLPMALLLRMAPRLAKSRPLELYPGWYFNCGWHTKNPITLLRRQIWARCYQSDKLRAVVIKWYNGLKIELSLGDDISQCLFIDGCIEPNEFVFLSKVIQPGMVFIDGGANIGLYTLFASKKVGPHGLVVAVEPSQREFDHLQRNLQLNNLANVKLLQTALSNRGGFATLQIAEWEHGGQNTLGNFVYPDIDSSHSVQVTLSRLDDLVKAAGLQQVDIIKLDVEGAEFSALDGARHILTTYYPLLLIEFSDAALRLQGSSAKEVKTLLATLGYTIYTFDSISGLPVKAGESCELSNNIVAVHPIRMWAELNANDQN